MATATLVVKDEKLSQETQSLTVQAKALTITTQADYEKVIQFGANVKEMRKKIEAHYKPIKQGIDASKKIVLDAEKESLKPVEDAEEYLSGIATTFRVAERKKADAAAEEERKRLLKVAEDEKLARAQKAQDAGKSETVVNRILDEEVKTAPVAPAPAVARAGEKRGVLWKYRVKDEAKVPRSFLMLNEVAIGAFVRATKKEGEVIDGIEAYSEEKTDF